MTSYLEEIFLPSLVCILFLECELLQYTYKYILLNSRAVVKLISALLDDICIVPIITLKVPISHLLLLVQTSNFDTIFSTV